MELGPEDPCLESGALSQRRWRTIWAGSVVQVLKSFPSPASQGSRLGAPACGREAASSSNCPMLPAAAVCPAWQQQQLSQGHPLWSNGLAVSGRCVQEQLLSMEEVEGRAICKGEGEEGEGPPYTECGRWWSWMGVPGRHWKEAGNTGIREKDLKLLNHWKILGPSTFFMQKILKSL